MSIVATSLDFMAHAAHGVANSVRTSLSKLPIVGYAFKGKQMGGLQNAERNPDLVALSKPVASKSTSFIYG